MLFYTYTVYTYFIFKVISALHWISRTDTLDTEIEVNYLYSPCTQCERNQKQPLPSLLVNVCFLFVLFSYIVADWWKCSLSTPWEMQWQNTKIAARVRVQSIASRVKKSVAKSWNLADGRPSARTALFCEDPCIVLFHPVIKWSRKLDTFPFLIARGFCSCDEKVNNVYLFYIHSQFCKIFLFYVSFTETCRHSKRDFLLPVPSSFHLCPPTLMHPQPTSAGLVLGKHKRLGGRV